MFVADALSMTEMQLVTDKASVTNENKNSCFPLLPVGVPWLAGFTSGNEWRVKNPPLEQDPQT